MFHYTDVIMGTIASPNHQPHDCLHKRLFRRRSKKTSRLRVTSLCVRNPVNYPHKWPVTRKMFPFDDVIMLIPTQKLYWMTYRHVKKMVVTLLKTVWKLPREWKLSYFKIKKKSPKSVHNYSMDKGYIGAGECWLSWRLQRENLINKSSLSIPEKCPDRFVKPADNL